MDGFAGGLIVGFLLGLVLGPVLRSWLLWREVESMRRESYLSEALLHRMDRDANGLDDDGFDAWSL